MGQIDYSTLLPTRPEADLVGWLQEQGELNQEFLIYKAGSCYDPLEERRRRAVEVRCTACGETFYADKMYAGGCGRGYSAAAFGWVNPRGGEHVINGYDTLCPCCGHPARTAHVGQLSYLTNAERCVITVGRVAAPGLRDRLTVTEWLIRRRVSKGGEKSYEVWPSSAYVVEEKRLVRLMGYSRYLTGVTLFGRWEQRRNYLDCAGKCHHIYPFDPDLPDGTTAENCRLDLYLAAGGKYPVSYLALWRRRPAVENLLVQGAGRLLCGLLEHEIDGRGFNSYTGTYGHPVGVPRLEELDWKQRRPAGLLGLNREEFRWAVRQDWTRENWMVYRMLRDAGVAVHLPEDMEVLRERKNYELNAILTEAPGEFWRTLRYLNRQKGDWHTLRDYRNMARQLGRNLEEGLVRWPRDLKAAHDRCMGELRAIRRAKEAAELAERRKKRAAPFKARAEALSIYAWELGGLLIRPCADEEELIREGDALHHCVATYAADIAAGKTAIFFIREADKPDVPYFTLELDEKKMVVRQNRGLRECDRTKKVEEFERKWLEWARTVQAKKKKGENRKEKAA